MISGGGTGGHVYPAIAIANALKKKDPLIDFLFIGAKGKLEMEKIPAAGYKIEGLWISGFQRSMTLKNHLFPVKLISSMIKAARIIREFKPELVIGVGGYASGPILRIASRKKIPTLIQEQNSYPGITNRILSGKVRKICVAYEGMERFFPAEKIILTGNPIRQDILNVAEKRDEAVRFFNLSSTLTTMLVIGGSLGARTINRSLRKCIERGIISRGIQLIWQTGTFYFDDLKKDPGIASDPSIHIYPFIERMDLAYAAADLIVSRAGAIAVSELCTVAKPVILVPSPNVAEDHQAKNARALADKKAAILVPDAQAEDKLFDQILDLKNSRELMDTLSRNITLFARRDAADRIAEEALSMVHSPEL